MSNMNPAVDNFIYMKGKKLWSVVNFKEWCVKCECLLSGSSYDTVQIEEQNSFDITAA